MQNMNVKVSTASTSTMLLSPRQYITSTGAVRTCGRESQVSINQILRIWSRGSVDPHEDFTGSRLEVERLRPITERRGGIYVSGHSSGTILA